MRITSRIALSVCLGFGASATAASSPAWTRDQQSRTETLLQLRRAVRRANAGATEVDVGRERKLQSAQNETLQRLTHVFSGGIGHTNTIDGRGSTPGRSLEERFDELQSALGVMGLAEHEQRQWTRESRDQIRAARAALVSKGTQALEVVFTQRFAHLGPAARYVASVRSRSSPDTTYLASQIDAYAADPVGYETRFDVDKTWIEDQARALYREALEAKRRAKAKAGQKPPA